MEIAAVSMNKIGEALEIVHIAIPIGHVGNAENPCPAIH
jgi:hypothetical protein